MEPNETVRRLRTVAGAVLRHADKDKDAGLLAFVEHFNALDQWLTRGGALPYDWDGKGDGE